MKEGWSEWFFEILTREGKPRRYQYAQEFQAKFKKNIPRKSTALKQNLLTVLEEARERKLVDVLLFLHKKEPPKIQTNFQVVKIKYKPTKGEYIKMI